MTLLPILPSLLRHSSNSHTTFSKSPLIPEIFSLPFTLLYGLGLGFRFVAGDLSIVAPMRCFAPIPLCIIATTSPPSVSALRWRYPSPIFQELFAYRQM
ncbi:hypothetical protein SLE2022_182450 [Rubroshorea leprosula]